MTIEFYGSARHNCDYYGAKRVSNFNFPVNLIGLRLAILRLAISIRTIITIPTAISDRKSLGVSYISAAIFKYRLTVQGDFSRQKSFLRPMGKLQSALGH